MSDNVVDIVIDSEDALWRNLVSALNNDFGDEHFRLITQGWGVIHLHFEGGPFESTITPALMHGFIELQKSVNRAAASLIYSEPNSLRLTSDEKKSFELVVKVSPGSSKFDIDFGKILNDLVIKVGKKMTGKQLLVAVLGLAALYTTSTAWKDYLNSQADHSKINLAETLSKEETVRLKVLKETLTEVSQLKEIREDLRDAQFQILKGGASANNLNMQGVSVTGNEATLLTKIKRERAVNLSIDDNFRILAVDTTNRDLVKVKVRGKNGEFLASFKDDSLDERQLGLLKDKLISRDLVRLEIDASTVRGVVSSAQILAVGRSKT